jgi:molybdate transport system regulatory protein
MAEGLSIRVDLGGGVRVGPGKIALLEAIASTGSISAAGRKLRMSYKRAWDLTEQLNHDFGRKLVSASPGGAGGGGAALTEHGQAVVAHYRAIEQAAAVAARAAITALEALTAAR